MVNNFWRRPLAASTAITEKEAPAAFLTNNLWPWVDQVSGLSSARNHWGRGAQGAGGQALAQRLARGQLGDQEAAAL